MTFAIAISSVLVLFSSVSPPVASPSPSPAETWILQSEIVAQMERELVPLLSGQPPLALRVRFYAPVLIKGRKKISGVVHVPRGTVSINETHNGFPVSSWSWSPGIHLIAPERMPHILYTVTRSKCSEWTLLYDVESGRFDEVGC